MTKPRNITPAEEAAWKLARNGAERRRRAANPETRAKEKAVRARYRSEEEFLKKETIYRKGYHGKEEVKHKNSTRRQRDYQKNLSDPVRAEKERIQSKEAGARLRTRRRDSAHFEHFMSMLESGQGENL